MLYFFISICPPRTIDGQENMSCPNDFFDCSALYTAGDDLPRFCCPDETRCRWTAANTTVICCPYYHGSTCHRIKPITCNINAQDPLLNPRSAVKTLATSIPLKECGSQCCPHGYRCRDDHCEALAEQDVPPGDDSEEADKNEILGSTDNATTTGLIFPSMLFPYHVLLY